VSPALRLGVLGFGMIAVCYGFARFAFGLFLAEVDADLSLGSTQAGVISGGSFFGYCIAIVASASMTERVGPRAVAVGAALVAAVGMAGIAVAPNPQVLAAAVLLAGSSTGLASPPMATAVAAAVRRDRQDATNTVINAGTGAGVALSGPIALAIGGQWRLAFAGFAAVAVVLAVAAAFVMPKAGSATAVTHGLPPVSGALLRLVGATFLMGAASTALWSFGGKLAMAQLGWGAAGVGMLWTAIGVGGIAGACAGALVGRFGIGRVHWAFLCAMSAGILAVGSAFATPAAALAGGALFGASYVMLTGVYLVWGVAAVPDRPATGLMVGFLTIAVGQTAGAPVFGLLMDNLGAGFAVTTFAALGLAAGMARTGWTPAHAH
jgi:predicted MFS family arabinose efflux permease